MASARRFLQTDSGQYPTLPAAEPPDSLAVDSDVVVILAALLCALICVIGLAAVTRCAHSRRNGAASSSTATKGLKKKALRALPKLSYEDAVAAAIAARGGASAAAGEEKILAECAICLSEFVAKEEIRVLPQCGHGFHVACVDTWLGAHSSCPSCRRVLVVDAPPKLPPEPGRCGKCEATGRHLRRPAPAATGLPASCRNLTHKWVPVDIGSVWLPLHHLRPTGA